MTSHSWMCFLRDRTRPTGSPPAIINHANDVPQISFLTAAVGSKKRTSRCAAKIAKTLLGPGAYQVVLGQEMELSAIQDPFSLISGQTLQVRVQGANPELADKDEYNSTLVFNLK